MKRKPFFQKLWEHLPETLLLAGIGGAVGYVFGPYDGRLSRRNATLVGIGGGLLIGLFDTVQDRGEVSRGIAPLP